VPLDPELSHLLDEFLGRVNNSISSGLRQGLADQLWASIPMHVNESAWVPSAVQLAVEPQTGDLEIIEAIGCFIPSGSSGWLQLGNNQLIPVGSGTTFMSPGKWLVAAGDARTLYVGTPGSQATAPVGPLWLSLQGRRLPTTSEMAN
jgi:hypothetical protein